MSGNINIAIDGYSSCGKGTLAKYLARQLGYTFIDSGAMYRAVTLKVLQAGVNPEDEEGVLALLPQIQLEFRPNAESGRQEVYLNGTNAEPHIRNMEVASAVSQVAKIPGVRRFLVEMQRQIAASGGCVMDGRDIGTVVIPDAELKIFMTARPEIRAKRRFAELEAAGVKTDLQSVLNNLIQRDSIDIGREDSPLTLTNDYKVLDNSDMDIDAQNELAMSWVKQIMGATN